MATSDGSEEQTHDSEELSFREAEDYVERRRQKEVLDAVQFVAEVQNATESEFERGQTDLETRRAEVRMAVNNLIVETEQLVRRAGETRLLKQKPLAEVTVSPPQSLLDFADRDDTSIWGGAALEAKHVDTIQGLLGYYNAPRTYAARWEVFADVPGDEPKTITSVAESRMPVPVSMQVYREIRSFLADVELDIDAELDPHTGQEGPGL